MIKSVITGKTTVTGALVFGSRYLLQPPAMIHTSSWCWGSTAFVQAKMNRRGREFRKVVLGVSCMRAGKNESLRKSTNVMESMSQAGCRKLVVLKAGRTMAAKLWGEVLDRIVWNDQLYSSSMYASKFSVVFNPDHPSASLYNLETCKLRFG